MPRPFGNRTELAWILGGLLFVSITITFLSITSPSDCVRDAHGYRACPGQPRHPLREPLRPR